MLKSIALSLARFVERGLERIGRRRDADPVLEAYSGYATPDGLVLRGRVLTHLREETPDPRQSRWVNFRQMLSLFVTDEVADVAVEGAGAKAISNAEGYVTLQVPKSAAEGEAGAAWAGVAVRIAGRPETELAFPVRLTGAADWLIISDVDDTIIETGAHSLARNLWTTFTGSALTRKVHEDARALMQRLVEGDRNPVFYVSSSPWNLHRFLDALMARNNVPKGPMLLRDLGVSEAGIGDSHHDHKGAAIDKILAANPGLNCFLMGDSGQKDAFVYRDAIRRHSGRVKGVALREPAPGVGADDAAAIVEIEAMGVPCFHGPNFEGALQHWGLQ